MIEIFEIFWSAPIELRVIILGGLISPFILLKRTKKPKLSIDYSLSFDKQYFSDLKKRRETKKF